MANNKDLFNCTTQRMRYSDLHRGCRLFAKELKFNKALHKKNIDNANYRGKDIDQLTRMAGAPLKLKIQVDGIHILMPG